ncbi:glycosyltransferase [Imhoffiella purpurea]|nr:glycosyltransferase [Imhoffiella purpurea]
MNSVFGRHGGIARMTRRAWRILPLAFPAKQRLRRFILDRLADGYRLFHRNHEVAFQPATRHLAHPKDFQPKITVAVPNYNHAAFLRQRLDSIYRQTYRHFQVILLDDASTDDSRAILEEYARRYSDITTTAFNTTNSGGVFRQWQRAIEAADTDLVWIAESDDYCDPHFLETLIPYFSDEAVKLVYSHSVFVTERGTPSDFRFDDYLDELSPTRWKLSYVETAHREVAGFLGRKNSIPNVSSAVFRKFDLSGMLAETDWLNMRICGDWIFYLHAIRGGKIAYTTGARNYYRLHSTNASARTYGTPAYYREHAQVAREMARLYRVPRETLEAHHGYIERFFDQRAGELAAQGLALNDFYDLDGVWETGQRRLPNILIAAFAFASGGGEIFPIRLANALVDHGYSVTFFDFRGEPMNPLVRDMLRPDIAVVELSNRFLESEDIVEAFGIEVVHTHHASVDQFFVSHKRAGESATHVVTMHGMYDVMKPSMFENALEGLYDAVSAWTYISNKNIAPFRDRGLFRPDRFFKIPNGMAMPEIRPIPRRSLGIGEDAVLLCVASRAIAEKGWREAIESVGAARRLSKLDIQLLLLGDGPLYDELRHESLPEYVHLMGFVKNAVDYYASADAGLLLTTFGGESFPLTVIECLMTGRPMIASDIGEIAEMLTDERGEVAGALVDISSGRVPVGAVTRMIADLATDETTYARKRDTALAIRSRFDLDRVIGMYAQVYRQAIETARDRANA